MPASAAFKDRQAVEAFLKGRESDQNSPGPEQLSSIFSVLIDPSAHLQDVPSTSTPMSSSGPRHWFCKQARHYSIQSSIATYLVYFFSFHRKSTAASYMDELESSLLSCPDCARAFNGAKRIFQRKYISKFPAATQENFINVVDKWQAELAIRSGGGGRSEETIFDLSEPALQLVFGSARVLEQEVIRSRFERDVSARSSPIPKLTRLGLTTGLLELWADPERVLGETPSSDVKTAVDTWVQSQITACAQSPLSLEEWSSLGFKDAWDRLLAKRAWRKIRVLADCDALSRSTKASGLLARSECNVIKTIANLVSTEGKVAEEEEGVSPRFIDMIRILSSLLRACHSEHIWTHADPSPEFPLVLLGDIKESPAFTRLLARRPNELDFDPLGWLPDFLLSVRALDAACLSKADVKAVGTGYSDALARIASWMWEDMGQQRRLDGELRARCAEAGFRTMLVMLDAPQTERSLRQVTESALRRVLDVHSTTITSIAFDKENHPNPVWSRARAAAIKLLDRVFQQDGETIQLAIKRLGRAANQGRKGQQEGVSFDFTPPVIHDSLWRKTYIAHVNIDAIDLAMRGLLRSTHLSLPRGNAWSHQGLEKWREDGRWAKAVLATRQAMDVMRDGFATKLSAFAAVSDTEALRQLWARPRVPEIAMRLLLCSDQTVHDAVIGLIQSTFDEVDARVDCIRALLLHYPGDAVAGLCHYLQQWSRDASDVPSGVEAARWQVRCFSDLIDVLCRQGGEDIAPLTDETFLSAKSPIGTVRNSIRELWSGMTICLAEIYRLTPKWAPFYENAEMVDWMTDALIFGRNMLEETRTFEAAISDASESLPASGSESPRNISDVGKKLIVQIEPVLDSITSWLRLTDVEILHQTFELVKLLLDRFSRTATVSQISPLLEKSVKTLDQYARRAKGHKSKLDDSQLSELAVLVAPFIRLDISDDDIEFISHSHKSASTSASTPAAPAAAKEMSSTEKKDAFTEMMRRASTKPGSQSKPPSSGSVIDVVDDDFDDVFARLSYKDLSHIEKSAREDQLHRHMKVAEKKVMRAAQERAQKQETDSRFGVRTAPRPTGLLGKIRREVATERSSKVIPERARLGPRPVVVPPPLRDAAGKAARAPSPDTDDSDSSDEEGGGVSALTGLQKSPSKAPRVVPKIQLIRNSTRVLTAQQREAEARHRMKMRQNPDTSSFIREILTWSEQTGPSACSAKALPGKFSTAAEYQSALLPLLLQEFWESCRKASEDFTISPPVKLDVDIAARYFTDDYIDLELGLGKGMFPPGFILNEMDICVLRSRDGKESLLIKIQSVKRTPRNQSILCRLHTSRDAPGLTVKSKWSLYKYVTLTTAIREYSALAGLPYYEPELLESILSAKPTPLPPVADTIVQSAMKIYNVNEPQARAIMGAMQAQGFVLIQGPPGTGKTKTITGLAGRFLDLRSNAVSVNERGQREGPKKLLVCAPSNAAIDEVARRLKDGVPSRSGGRIIPKVVRVGADAVINAAVKDISLDALVEARVTAVKDSKGGEKDSAISRAEQALNQIKADREAKLAELPNATPERKVQLEAELQQLVSMRMSRSRDLNSARDAARDMRRQLDSATREAREAILAEADIICCTLAGAGSKDGVGSFEFETVIIDEAAQAVELGSLIPLKYRCRRAILIGDPKQLPPTVLSRKCEELGYNRSLFVRMAQNDPEAMHLLSIQYRMHPDISQLPSRVFYNRKLLDGDNMAEKTRAPWHVAPLYGTYRFFNVHGVESRGALHSIKNTAELQAIVSLYRGLKQQFGQNDRLLGKIGIISMYREQVGDLKRTFGREFGQAAFDDVDFGTVDGFQGQEKDIIILSCVRSGPELRSVGFLNDERRVNVALTRAKSSLFVFGNAPTLARLDPNWREIVNNAQERGSLLDFVQGMFFGNGNDAASAPLHAIAPPPKYKPPPVGPKPQALPAPKLLSKKDPGPLVTSAKRPAETDKPVALYIGSGEVPRTAAASKRPADVGPSVAASKRPADVVAAVAPKKRPTEAIKGKDAEATGEPKPKKIKKSKSGEDRSRQSTSTSSSSRDGTPTGSHRPAPPTDHPPPSPAGPSVVRLANGTTINASGASGLSARPAMPIPRPAPPGVGPPKKQDPNVLFMNKKKVRPVRKALLAVLWLTRTSLNSPIDPKDRFLSVHLVHRDLGHPGHNQIITCTKNNEQTRDQTTITQL